LFVSGGLIEAEEGELDLWVAWVAVELTVGRSEGTVDESDIFLDGFKEEVVLVVLMMCNGSFDKMACVVPEDNVSRRASQDIITM
jgi:hypothetical protein